MSEARFGNLQLICSKNLIFVALFREIKDCHPPVPCSHMSTDRLPSSVGFTSGYDSRTRFTYSNRMFLDSQRTRAPTCTRANMHTRARTRTLHTKTKANDDDDDDDDLVGG